MEVLCEGEEPETGRCFGRTYADSPDIDGRVLFSAARSVSPGEFVMVPHSQTPRTATWSVKWRRMHNDDCNEDHVCFVS